MQEQNDEGFAQTCEMHAETPSPDWGKITARCMIIAGKHDRVSDLAAAKTIQGG